MSFDQNPLDDIPPDKEEYEAWEASQKTMPIEPWMRELANDIWETISPSSYLHAQATCNEILPLIAAAYARHVARDGELRRLLKNLRWKSIEKDNMEFQCTVTCYEMDEIKAALAAGGDG